jgi:hypothetical protein
MIKISTPFLSGTLHYIYNKTTAHKCIHYIKEVSQLRICAYVFTVEKNKRKKSYSLLRDTLPRKLNFKNFCESFKVCMHSSALKEELTTQKQPNFVEIPQRAAHLCKIGTGKPLSNNIKKYTTLNWSKLHPF